MATPSNRLIYLVLGLFVLVIGLMGWGFIYDHQTKFVAGTESGYLQEQLPDPTLPILRERDPKAGSNEASALKIVIFSDLGCVTCRLTQRELLHALERSGVKAQVIWRDLPSGLTQQAITPSLYSVCLQKVGKFWEFHDAVIASNITDEEGLRRVATNLGVASDTLSACVSNTKTRDLIGDDLTIARQNRIAIAPTFFIGSQKPISGFLSQIQFKNLIQQASR